MLFISIAFFTLGAILGIILISYVLMGQETPKAIVFLHGPMVLLGIIFLVIFSIFNTPRPTTSLALFLIAALGGLFLLFRDLTGRSVPKWLASVHAAIAVIGFIFLVRFAVQTW